LRPHCAQNRASGAKGAPHPAHVALALLDFGFNSAPHEVQNFPGATLAPHAAQTIPVAAGASV
jgi:hypothetical protein